MVREKLIEKRVGGNNSFRWRSHEISRIEGLSDAVFAFAVTLLVISLEVPKTFTELVEAMHGFIAFAISFALLFQVWFLQYTFFRRYGLQDNTTIVLNAILLFVALCYVYPLKFLFTMLVNVFSGAGVNVHLPDGRVEPAIVGGQASTLMIIYGLGFIAVFFVFAMLYHHAYRKREALELNKIEVFDTQSSVQRNLIFVGIGILSILIAWIGGPQKAGWSGFTYGLIPPAMYIQGSIRGKKRRKLEKSLKADAVTA